MDLTKNDILDIEMRLARGDVRADDVRNLLAALADMPLPAKSQKSGIDKKLAEFESTLGDIEMSIDDLKNALEEIREEIEEE